GTLARGGSDRDRTHHLDLRARRSRPSRSQSVRRRRPHPHQPELPARFWRRRLMTLAILLVGGLVLGFGLERLLGRRRSPFRIFGFMTLILLLLLVAVGVGGWFWANSVFDRVERVDVGNSLEHGDSGTNYLLVGADNGPDSEEREGVEGVRSDTIMILNIEG